MSDHHGELIELPLQGVVREHGLWCPRCALPSGVVVDVFGLTTTGVREMGTVKACSSPQCDWTEE